MEHLTEHNGLIFTLNDVHRSYSWSGYDYIPTIRGGLAFKVPQKGTYSGRIVEYSKIPGQIDWVKMVELWSLNGDGYTFPFFPGVKDPDFLPSNLSDTFYPRLDGHLGPFDVTEHPQEYDAAQPWLPFIQPYRKLVEWACVLPALIQKQDNVCAMDEGLVGDLLRRNFCLDLQLWHVKEKLHHRNNDAVLVLPTFPECDTIHLLLREASYPKMLDCIVAIQRGLRIKDACITYHSLPPMSNSNSSSTSFRDKPIPPADMSFLGLWGNALNSEELAWYHNVAKVPVYFSHELSSEEMADLLKASTYTPCDLTIFHRRFGPGSPYDSFAVEKAVNAETHALPSGACTPEKQVFKSCTPFSSSRMQGYSEMREPRSDRMVQVRLEAKNRGYHDYEWKGDLSPVWHSDVALSYPRRMIYKSRVAFIETPRVEEIRTPFDLWDHIYQVKDESTLSDEQGQWCFLHANKNDARFDGQIHNTWYDRRRSMAIHFTVPDHLTFPSGFIMPQELVNIYGAPPPPWRIYSPLANGHTLLQEDGISWMYPQLENCSAEHKLPILDSSRLPFINSPGVTYHTMFHLSPSEVPPHFISIGVMTEPDHSFVSTGVMTMPQSTGFLNTIYAAPIIVANPPQGPFRDPWPDAISSDTDDDGSSVRSKTMSTVSSIDSSQPS
ncbi:uncharacterized protein EV420DRAFT_1654361 [Desarmillaria tabescens]|uniref:Uncharacterized protein n=1 Tax=Armillaria tabescens TaxID=1929756 RepID=A0AA39J2X1_ARMTA|nr:uncharacterized protein EV420DRAFT_1654361 [Desarmillaria tabescens]KAK0433839.1 hypothetical protein EV420DRAFT_1654361 [Desarmillaria tabescens]